MLFYEEKSKLSDDLVLRCAKMQIYDVNKSSEVDQLFSD